MTELENKILKAQDAYYNGNPIMSDIEFDELWDKLKSEQPDSEILRNVGADHIDGFPKRKHMILMGSQNKAKNITELQQWIKNNKIDTSNVIAQFKCDGCLDYDTILETDLGPMKIGEIVEKKITCKVKSFDINNLQEVYTPIKNFFINYNNDDWYKLTLDNGKTIKITGNHRVWLPELLCWRKVKDLKEGDIFLTEKE